MKKTISVAMCTFNGEPYLIQQLDSILSQSYPIHELVICDDCSTDKTINILNEYQSRYPDIIHIYVNKQNLGFIKNFEKALSLCSGDFIALSDQDDVWLPDKISCLMSTIDHTDLVHSDAYLVDSEGKELYDSYSTFACKLLRNQSFTDLCINNTVTGCTVMINSNLQKRAVPFPTCIPHDQWLAMLAMDGNGISYTDKKLILYRQHAANLIGAKLVSKTTQSVVKTDKREIKRNRLNRYSELLALTQDRLSPTNLRLVQRIVCYYDSYFTNIFRPRALFFHLINFRCLSYRKTFFRSVVLLVLSFFGEGRKHVSK